MKIGESRRIYYPGLDTLRGFFAVSVVLFHFFLQQIQLEPAASRSHLFTMAGAGGFGVPFFFVLSSFLITDLLLTEQSRKGRIDISAFYGRRILRVWPVYYAALLIGMFVIDPYTQVPSMLKWLVPFGFFFANNTIAGQSIASPPMTYAPLWSVSIEEQFYLVWPWVMRVANEKRLILLGALLVFAGLACHIWRFNEVSHLHEATWFHTVSHLDSFGVGVLTCLACRAGLGGSLQKWPGAVGFAVVAFLVTLQVATGTLIRQPEVLAIGVWAYTLVPLAAGLLILSCAQPAEALSTFWKHPIGLWFGRLSYGIYAYHGFGIQLVSKSVSAEPAAILSRLLALFAITLAFAVVSYYCLERPILRLKSRLQKIPSGIENAA